MSAIFNNASSIKQGNKLSLMSASTISGKRVSQRRGPFLYTFEVGVNVMSTDSTAYSAVRSEIASMDYGLNPITTTIPTMTIDGGSWSGTPVVSGNSQTGRTLNLTGFNPSQTNVILDGDFIQLANNGKVYQAIGNYSSNSSGDVSVAINSALVTSPVTATAVTHGTAVTFTLAIDEADFTMEYTPKGLTSNLVSPGKFSFTEVIV